MKILIVDDDVIDRKAIKRALNSSTYSSHEIYEAESVAEGLKAQKENTFDVILLDYIMPEIDGIEMVIELRSQPSMGNTAIIIISGSDDQSLALVCIEAGAQDFLCKNEITRSKVEKSIIHAKKRFEVEQRMHASYLAAKEMAEKDPLTGLSNRYHFEELLKASIINSKSCRNKVALLALDLDNFKHVNDTMGHEAGDRVLIESVRRIQSCLCQNEGFARLGGDEFAVLLHNINSVSDVNIVANKVLNAFSRPFIINGREVTCGISIGGAITSEELTDESELLKCADIAMYRSKQQGKNSVSFYESYYQIEFNRRFTIENEMNRILDNSSFRLFYQPIYSTHTNSLSGFEALIRWPEEDNMYTPDVFIPIAEESRLINRIGKWVIKTSIEQLSIWHRTFDNTLSISINISPVQLQDIELVVFLSSIIEQFNIEAKHVILEITETALIKDNDKVTQVLYILSEKGFNIALDDFGMGFSSVAHLMNYPIDIVKLDKSMQTTEDSSEKHRKVFDAISLMLKKLEFIIVAEGIENEQQLALCKDLKLERVQGFLLAKPLREQEVDTLLEYKQLEQMV